VHKPQWSSLRQERYPARWALVRVAMFAGTLSSAACDLLPPQVTCESLRSVRVGMTSNDVLVLLGSPYQVVPGKSAGEREADEVWEYTEQPFWHRTFGSVSIYCSFAKNVVLKCWAGERNVLTNEKKMLFTVDSTVFNERPQFKKAFGCRP
jgi:hypothetical protein